MEHCLRQTVIAMRIADRLGIVEGDRVATYYTGLLANVYCHADAHEQAEWFGDDIVVKHGSYEPHIFEFVRMIGASERGLARARKIAAFPGQGVALYKSMYDTHTRLASPFAARRGLDAAREYARKRRGRTFDPALADLFITEAPELVAGIDAASSCWEDVIGAEPSLTPFVGGDDLDAVLEAMADLVDMKSPWMSGHSRRLANLALEAGRISGLAADELSALHRAGFLHDLGRLGISNAIWDKPGPLTPAEREHTRLHPYLTGRMLAGVPALARSRELAANHHERLDGSGYPRGSDAAQLTPADRLLAAADAYHAMTEPRAHRAAMPESEAASELRSEVRAGRLDGEAVHSVLTAAG